jgi:predicted O-methyltransferase YrrM
MSDLLAYDIEKYIADHTTGEPNVLHQNYREANLTTYYPQMLSGKVQAKFLEMICRMLQPKRILEIGTFTGYSAIAMAGGLPPGGLLYTIEINEEREEMIQKYIALAGMKDKIKLLIGDAVKIIPEIDEVFDLIFIDANKEQYVDYYERSMEKLRPGGFILADNVLWGGKAVRDEHPDKETRGIQLFNTHVKNDTRVEQVILSVRDGLMMVRKL